MQNKSLNPLEIVNLTVDVISEDWDFLKESKEFFDYAKYSCGFNKKHTKKLVKKNKVFPFLETFKETVFYNHLLKKYSPNKICNYYTIPKEAVTATNVIVLAELTKNFIVCKVPKMGKYIVVQTKGNVKQDELEIVKKILKIN